MKKTSSPQAPPRNKYKKYNKSKTSELTQFIMAQNEPIDEMITFSKR